MEFFVDEPVKLPGVAADGVVALSVRVLGPDGQPLVEQVERVLLIVVDEVVNGVGVVLRPEPCLRKENNMKTVVFLGK